MGNEFAAIFQEEAQELLESLEQDLLDLEDAPEDSDIVDRVFRTMHTIKGSGAMFGFTDVANFTHHVENILAEVREGRLAVTRELISLILESRDHITSLIVDDNPSVANGDDVVKRMNQLLHGSVTCQVATTTKDPEIVDEPASSAPSIETLLEICSTIAGDIFVLVGTPGDLGVLGRIRDEFNSISKGLMQQHGWSEFSTFPHQVACNLERVMLSEEISLPFLDICDTARNFLEDALSSGEPPKKNQYQEILKSLEVEIGILVVVDEGPNGDENDSHGEKPNQSIRSGQNGKVVIKPPADRIGEILVEKGHVEQDILADVMKQQKFLGEMLVDANVVSQDIIDDAMAEQKQRRAVQRSASAQSKVLKTDSIRVAAEKLDILINLVGELVVTQARLSEIGGAHPGSELLESIEDVERLTSELRECVLSVRMLPIGTSFSRFKRLVRDLSNDLGKDVQLLTSGAETELDKTMLEMLSEPLVHLIRNAVDHGIEVPDVREAVGKSPFGTISLSAVHSGPNVVVTVSDDGKGIDVAALLRKGKALGLVSSDVDPLNKKVLELIFQPGMSTSTEINTVSGRGVGMDVVHSSIMNLKGTVSVTSQAGMGTTFTLTLPLTMSIIDGLLVQSSDTRFILPLLQIEECVELYDHGVSQRNGRHVYQFRDQLIPFIRLREFYNFAGGQPELEQMVIVRMKKDFLGIVVDHVIGDHQTVIKSLGWVYRKAPGLSGATILGDGQVALIIDVAGIHGHSMSEELCAV